MHPVLNPSPSSLARSSATTDTIVVIGAGGGAGASTLVSGLAHVLGRGTGQVGVLDLDRFGGGLDVVFGIERAEGLRWAQVAGSQGELDGPALFEALPRAGHCAVLSFGREATSVPDHVFTASLEALSEVCDVLLVDVPRGNDLLLIPQEAAVVVVGDGSVRGGSATGSVLQSLRATGREPVVVLRDASAQFADELADALSVEVVTHLASERRVEHDLARGDQPGSRGELAKVCARLAEVLLDRPVTRAA